MGRWSHRRIGHVVHMGLKGHLDCCLRLGRSLGVSSVFAEHPAAAVDLVWLIDVHTNINRNPTRIPSWASDANP